MKARKWVKVRHFQGEPKDGDLKIEEEDLPALKDGDVLLEAVCWSVDPYMRGMSAAVPIGGTMPGQLLSKVTESKNTKHPVGKHVLIQAGWRDRLVCNPDTFPSRMYSGQSTPTVWPVADTADLSKTLTMGVLGMPGATSYFGFLEICQPKPGETVLVNGAAGAVGSLVGQIAKIKGCTVIGFAGTDEKVRHIKEDLGFDFAYNYKKTDVDTALREAAPGGIDCYFDNVGGKFTADVIMKHMKLFGRISVCGMISQYNNDPTKPNMIPDFYRFVLGRQLKMEGFIVTRWFDRFNEAWVDILKWIQEGKVKYREHTTKGFETMYAAFRGILKGENIGKAVITA